MGILFRPSLGDFTILKGPPPEKDAKQYCPPDPALDDKTDGYCYPSLTFSDRNKSAPSSYNDVKFETEFYYGSPYLRESLEQLRATPPTFQADSTYYYPVNVPLEKYLSWFSVKEWSFSFSEYVKTNFQPRMCIVPAPPTPPPEGWEPEPCGQSLAPNPEGETEVPDGYIVCGNETERSVVYETNGGDVIKVGEPKRGVVEGFTSKTSWGAGRLCTDEQAPPLIMSQIDKVARDESGKPIKFSSDNNVIGRPGPISLLFLIEGSVSYTVNDCPETKLRLSFPTKGYLKLTIYNRFFISEDKKTCWPAMTINSWKGVYNSSSDSHDIGLILEPASYDTNFRSAVSQNGTITTLPNHSLFFGNLDEVGTASIKFDGISMPLNVLDEPFYPDNVLNTDINIQASIDPVSYASYS